MKCYTVIAKLLEQKGTDSYYAQNYGPFESRTEAERCITALAGTGKYLNIAMVVMAVEDQD